MIVRDLTMPQAELLADLIHALPHGVVLCDQEGQILLANAEATRLLPALEEPEACDRDNLLNAAAGTRSGGGSLRVTRVPLGSGTAYLLESAPSQGVGRRPPYRMADILTRSSAVQELKRLAGLAAAADTMPVLLLGESGTGKELFAQAIHNASPRRDGPFVAVNCASVPESLLEAEFFGYEEGAFTGARRGGRPGLFQRADGGTLFLDEVSEMAPSLQAKLLRAIQNKEIERVGGTRALPVDVRFIAASNRDLPAMAAREGFRPDLYYRLSVMTLCLPPLRARREDIPMLVHALLREVSGSAQLSLAPEAEHLLEAYHWPGNVRELRNALQRAAALCSDGTIVAGDLPPEIRTPARGGSTYRAALEAAEREAVQGALLQAGGNRSRAARLLGLSRSAFYEKMRDLQIR